MDDVATRRLNEQIRREQRSIKAWKDKYGKRKDYLFPENDEAAKRMRGLKAQIDKLARFEFKDMGERRRALEDLRTIMGQVAVDCED